MGRKCGVEGCLSDSNRIEDVGVTFHKVPMQSEVRAKWLKVCRIPEEKKSVKVVYVCSRHFLRADFCNFKGKKYMLRQGVFPSVFPWDKSKLEAIKSEKHQNKIQMGNTNKKQVDEAKTEATSVSTSIKKEIKEEVVTKKEDIKSEPVLETKVKIEDVTSGTIDFSINNHIFALDFNNRWYPAKIVEVDEEENEVLIHFENNANEYDEWICMDSPRLRPFDSQEIVQNIEESTSADTIVNEDSEEPSTVSVIEDSKKIATQTFEVGERCLAYWSEKRKFPATVTKVMEDDMYEVLFDDGYVKCVKWSRLVKSQQHLQSSPLFDPVKSTKQERRDKKRKINVAELFGIGKRQRSENAPGSPKVRTPVVPVTEPGNKNVVEADNWVPDDSSLAEKPKDEVFEENGKWLPRWIDGHPVGIDSQIELHDGLKKSVIVPDPRLPDGWAKHLLRKYQGMMAGKWETIIVSPDGKRFRSRYDIKNYLESTKLMPYDEKIFDFSMYKQRQRKSTPNTEAKKQAELKAAEVKVAEIKQVEIETPVPEISKEEENLLKIPIIDDAYKCPIEGCGKNFRKENLAQMHVKHYHPEYSRFLDTTPNVADLAYARTVGDSLDKSPVPAKPSRPKNTTPKMNQNAPPSPCPIPETENHSQSPVTSKTKDAEIIKLLNTKPYDSRSEGEPLPSGLPPNMYPDIKLKDLLSKSEGIPKRDDINLRTLSITRPPAGIKTLLPVRKAENKTEENLITPTQDTIPKTKSKNSGKRKKVLQEHTESSKPKEIKEEVSESSPAPPTEPSAQAEISNVIMEGGELIKIVRMKQEEIINCTCGYMEEDGLMIQCELCLCWQHAYCNNIQKESEVPDKYVCYICQHPLRQRNSRKFYHDQDWMKMGVLPVGSYHTKDEEVLQKRFERLKKSHDISGGLMELQEFVNTLKVKLKIAEAKNHPKLYLWSKPWEKLPLPEKLDEKNDDKVKDETAEEKLENEDENQLNKDLKSMIESNPQVPIIPQPEAAIETADCRLNLLDHILHSQNLVMERLDNFEKELDDLEENCSSLEKDENYPRTRQTLQMLMRDLGKLEELSQNTSI
ncbi:hypothetical protein HHI36_004321 [Cryptolaemus montrouzieri]|uniref:Uncharacterized protein n=1 Tax=Cryptolaemus montrouzieri TaxID=559131 RepID=A0ABD2NRN3_9CUCU